ncbi:glycosyltransferase family 2 protein [Salidesulfovibrio onnuriiensis]|uniref:glycosyltransferase family 2 protein n=1 Tax=Salidesulfovibrio onnuriiensis TaxID=2583823 RepID=UPI00202B2407|nr:glycosyltransferase family 2 protein [Salidesulfovibrio onnuriiensis]
MPVRDISLWDEILHDTSIRVHPLPAGTNAGDARNSAIEHSLGSYLLCLRPDYRLDPKYLSSVLAKLNEPAGQDIAYGDYIRLPNRENRAIKSGYVPLPDFNHDLLRTSNILGPAVLFRREVWEESDGFRDNTVYTEWDFWVQAALRGREFVHVSYPLASCDNRPTTFRERAEDARGKAMIVINNQAYFHMHTVRWAMAYLRGDAWASSWAFMRLPGPMDVSRMMFEHNVQRMGASHIIDKAIREFPARAKNATSI